MYIAGTQLPAHEIGYVARRTQDLARREHDVVRIERRAVGPFHAMAQMPNDRLSIGGESAIANRRDLRVCMPPVPRLQAGPGDGAARIGESDHGRQCARRVVSIR
jgi:hypothetical protein